MEPYRVVLHPYTNNLNIPLFLEVNVIGNDDDDRHRPIENRLTRDRLYIGDPGWGLWQR